MSEIVTNNEVLCKLSEPINNSEVQEVVSQLKESIPLDSLGLAAPQIGIHKRVFIANLSIGSFAFINPDVIWDKRNQAPSTERCLSVPDTYVCIARYTHITVNADLIINLSLILPENATPKSFKLQYRDAFIIQHENDHLNGLLITNHPQVKDTYQQLVQNAQDRKKRVMASQSMRKNKKKPSSKQPKISHKKAAKLAREKKKQKKKNRTLKRREKIRVKIQERYQSEKENLFLEKDDSPETV